MGMGRISWRHRIKTCGGDVEKARGEADGKEKEQEKKSEPSSTTTPAATMAKQTG